MVENTPVSETNNFGKFLFELRRSAKLTQKQLADGSECSQSHISHLETGVRPITERRIRKLAGALDINPTKLYRAAEMHVMQFDLPNQKIGRPKKDDQLRPFTVQATEEQFRSLELYWDFLRYSKVHKSQTTRESS